MESNIELIDKNPIRVGILSTKRERKR